MVTLLLLLNFIKSVYDFIMFVVVLKCNYIFFINESKLLDNYLYLTVLLCIRAYMYYSKSCVTYQNGGQLDLERNFGPLFMYVILEQYILLLLFYYNDLLEGEIEIKLRYRVDNTGWVEIDDFSVDIQTNDAILAVDSVSVW